MVITQIGRKKLGGHHACLGDTVYTRVQVERVYKSNPIFEAKNTTFLEKVWFFSFHQLNKINRWSGIQG